MNLTLDVNSIFQAVTLLLLAGAGKTINDKLKKIDSLAESVKEMKTELHKKIDHEDVIILRRDLDTCFVRVDELREQLKELKNIYSKKRD